MLDSGHLDDWVNAGFVEVKQKAYDILEYLLQTHSSWGSDFASTPTGKHICSFGALARDMTERDYLWRRRRSDLNF